MLSPTPAPSATIDRSACGASRHGTPYARHRRGCVCPDAELATRRDRKRRAVARARGQHGMFVDVTGTRRRLQALAVLGYGTVVLGELLGMPHTNVWNLRAPGRKRLVHRRTVARIAALYEQLRDTPAPPGPRGSASRARATAARHGWHGPDRWHPEDLDDPLGTPLGAPAGIEEPMLVWDDIAALDTALLGYPDTEDGRTARDARIASMLNVPVQAVTDCRTAARRAAASARPDRAKLSDQQVLDIRARYLTEVRSGRLTRKQLASDYGVDASTLHHVLTGRHGQTRRWRQHLGLSDLLADSPRAGCGGRRSTRRQPMAGTPADVAHAHRPGSAARGVTTPSEVAA